MAGETAVIHPTLLRLETPIMLTIMAQRFDSQVVRSYIKLDLNEPGLVGKLSKKI